MGQIPFDLKSKISCLAGVVIGSGKAVILFTSDKLVAEQKPHVVVGFWDDSALRTENHTWTAVAVEHSKNELFVLGGEGEILTGTFRGMHLEMVIDIESLEGKGGVLRNVSNVNESFFIVGMEGQIYRRNSSKLLTSFDQGVPETVDFEAISGFNENDMYAVGWKGEIWHFDGSSWKRVDSPTNLILTAVLCAPDGYVYATGQSGVLIKGRKSSWTIIDHEFHNEYFWSLAWFSNSLFISSNHLILKCDGSKLTPMSFGEDIPFTFARLSVADDTLWSFGPKDIMEFDGASWKRIF